MSDLTRDLATLRARLDEALQEINALRKRLKTVADCSDRRCSLCPICLMASGAARG